MERIRRILIKVQPPIQPNRILRGKPPNVRIIVPEGVVVQARFAVQVLPLQSQVLASALYRAFVVFVLPVPLFYGRVAPGLVAGFPGHYPVVAGQLFRRAVDVGVEVKNLFLADLLLILAVLDSGQRGVAVLIFIDRGDDSGAAFFLQHPHAAPDKPGGAKAVAFADSAAQRVVVVAGVRAHPRALAAAGYELAFAVPLEL